MEHVRITAPDLLRRAALEKTRGRLVVTALGFVLLFIAVIGKLADATILQPLMPHRPAPPLAELVTPPKASITAALPGQRAEITDRNGQILAISMPTVSVFADPRQMIDPVDGGEEAEAGAATPRPRHGDCTLVGEYQAVRLPRTPDHAARGGWRSMTSASPASTSSPARSAATRWATSRPRCLAASTWTSMASPASRNRSTSG